MTSEVVLKKARPRIVKRRSGNGGYVSSPWGDIWGPTRRKAKKSRRGRTAKKRTKRRKQKSILNWLFQ